MRVSNTTNVVTLATPTAFTYYVPNTDADLVAALNAQAATISLVCGMSLNFLTASLTITSNTVLVLTRSYQLNFGAASGYRINNNGGLLIFRNGGAISYSGAVNDTFLNGYLNVYNSELVYTLNNPGSARMDPLSPLTSSNCMSSLRIVYTGGAAAGYRFYTHLEPLAGKFGSLRLDNQAVVAAAAGTQTGINVQFGNGVYANVTMPQAAVPNTSVVQPMQIWLARQPGNNSVLTNPVIFGSNLSVYGDGVATAQLIDEIWPDLPSGTVGTLSGTAGWGNTVISRQFTYYPGTLFVAGNNVSWRITNAAGTAITNGPITSDAGVLLTWQTFTQSTATNRGPFNLLARRKDLQEVQINGFAPTAPITYNSPLLTDPTYTADASTETGIAVSTAASTLTLSSAVTNDRIYDYGKYWLQLNLATPTYLSPNGAILTFVPTWTVLNVNQATAGTKIDTLASATAFTATGVISTNKITGNVIENTPTNITNTTITGNLTYNTNTPITVVFTNSTITGTVSNSGTGLVTITLASGSTIGTVGSNVVTQRFANVTAPNIIVGSRVQLYDTTNNVELFNGVLASALNYQHTYVGDITVRLRATYQSGLTAKLPVAATGLLTATGLSFLNGQTDDGVYIGNLINGSTVTEYTPDYPNLQVDVAGGSSTTVQRLYNWSTYIETTADGIRYLFAAISAIDAVNYLIDQAILDVKLDNTGATPVVISGGVITRKDGTTVIAATSGSIQIDPAKAYVANSAEISIDLQTIKNYTAASV
jgi:hypothetical protein